MDVMKIQPVFSTGDGVIYQEVINFYCLNVDTSSSSRMHLEKFSDFIKERTLRPESELSIACPHCKKPAEVRTVMMPNGISYYCDNCKKER